MSLGVSSVTPSLFCASLFDLGGGDDVGTTCTGTLVRGLDAAPLCVVSVGVWRDTAQNAIGLSWGRLFALRTCVVGSLPLVVPFAFVNNLLAVQLLLRSTL